jgi:hypothetical protein
MAPATPADLAAVEARLLAILAPYRADLETFDLYGVDTIRQFGAGTHDWFAGVKPAAKHVSLFLLPAYLHPELLDGVSPELLRRKTGKSVFAFRTVEEPLLAELEALVRRSHALYLAEHPKPA